MQTTCVLKNIQDEKPEEFECVLICLNDANKHRPKHLFAHFDNDDTPHWVTRAFDRVELADASYWMKLPFHEPFEGCE